MQEKCMNAREVYQERLLQDVADPDLLLHIFSICLYREEKDFIMQGLLPPSKQRSPLHDTSPSFVTIITRTD